MISRTPPLVSLNFLTKYSYCSLTIHSQTSRFWLTYSTRFLKSTASRTRSHSLSAGDASLRM